MSKLTYRIGTGILSWPGKGRWNAVTGVGKRYRLPKGMYEIGRREITPYTTAIGKPFHDETGQGFFVPIFPTFETGRGKSGGRLGIHPDGGVPGTLGCIGITSNAKSFFDAIASSAADAKLKVEVVA